MLRYLIILSLLWLNAYQKPAASKEKISPNVLFIIADDLNMTLGAYGFDTAITPNIDRLAAQGMQFKRAFVQASLCNPSRVSYMTGLYPHQLGVWRNNPDFRELHPEIATIPQHFRNNGYHSAGIGKNHHNWGHELKGDPDSWSEPEIYHWGAHFHDWYVPGRPYQMHHDLRKGPAVQRKDVPDEAYIDGRIANAAVNKLRELQETPFFLSVGFWKPHLPFNAPAKYWDMYDEDNIPQPRYRAPVDGVPDIAYVNSHEARTYTDVPNDGPISESQKKELRHGYLAAITYLDAQIGKVLDELDRLDMADNTIVVFFSDHGFHAGEHGQFGKWTNFEIGTAVPLLVRYPGLTDPGSVSKSIVELVDLYPTLLEICGLKPPDHELSGVSMVPVLKDRENRIKKFAISQIARPLAGSPVDDEIRGSTIRDERYRYNVWRRVATGEVLAEELYDLQDDPFLVENVIDDPRLARVRNELNRKLTQVLNGS